MLKQAGGCFSAMSLPMILSDVIAHDVRLFSKTLKPLNGVLNVV
jgi:hypothetical protein